MLSLTDPAVTVQEAEDYLSARGLSEDVTEAALRRGQDHIAREYNGRWAEDWENGDAPEAVKFAIIEAARREAAQPGSLAPVVTPAQVKVLTQVEGIRWEPLRAADPVSGMKPRLTAVEGLLAPHIRRRGLFLERA